MLSYRVILDVPFQQVLFVSRLLAERRREIGTRRGTRALTCWKQAVFVLAWFRDRPDIRRLGQGFGISQATAYRYLNEAIEVLADRAPSLREALEKAEERGLPYLILDGTIIAADRCAEKTISRKGRRSTAGTPARRIIPAGTSRRCPRRASLGRVKEWSAKLEVTGGFLVKGTGGISVTLGE